MEIEIKWDPTSEKKTKELDEYDKWELAQRILLPESEGGMSGKELVECFGTMRTCEIFHMDYLDVREKYIAWRKKKEGEIHVGDEVETSEGIYVKMIATKVTETFVFGISFDGQVHSFLISKVKKTGKRFTHLINVLKDYDSFAE